MTYSSCLNLKLTQVVILSRHNIRAPISDELQKISPKQWPQWSPKVGELTRKGAVLEGYMGKYFAQWLKKEGIFNKTSPNDENFYAYTNNNQRTKVSAQSFIGNAFPNSNVKLYHAKKNDIDTNFLPIIRNTSDAFKVIARKEMLEKLTELRLESSFSVLQDILDFENSDMCKKITKCDLVHDVSTIANISAGRAPEITGPLHMGTLAVDSFLMSYYEGFPLKYVAWGKIKEEDQWDKLTSIVKAYNNIRFNTTSIANDIAKPLIMLMREKLKEGIQVTFLMGHDANLMTIGRVLGLKHYVLPKQHEIIPIGGKIVFQKWRDEKSSRDLLKINYVYQSSEQLRMASELDLNKPPQSVTLELKKCPIDQHGYALWDDFIGLLDSF